MVLILENNIVYMFLTGGPWTLKGSVYVKNERLNNLFFVQKLKGFVEIISEFIGVHRAKRLRTTVLV